MINIKQTFIFLFPKTNSHSFIIHFFSIYCFFFCTFLFTFLYLKLQVSLVLFSKMMMCLCLFVYICLFMIVCFSFFVAKYIFKNIFQHNISTKMASINLNETTEQSNQISVPGQPKPFSSKQKIFWILSFSIWTFFFCFWTNLLKLKDSFERIDISNNDFDIDLEYWIENFYLFEIGMEAEWRWRNESSTFESILWFKLT